VSTAQDLPVPLRDTVAAPALRLVPTEPLDFDEAVRSLRPRLHRYAIRRLGDVHEAEELVQEALLRAYSHREQLLTEDDLGAWATVVTGRLVIDRLRVRGRSTSVADVPEGSRVSRDTADVVVARDEARVALDALDAMPPRQAALLWAREVEGQTYEELCDRFAMTEPAVRSVLTRARKALRKEYALRGGTLPAGGLAVVAPWLVGLTWAEKLRRAAGKIVAPAALGTAGIATLGGLIFSPFGVLPSQKAPVSPFTPSHAVVIDRELAPHLTTPVGVADAATALTPGAQASVRDQVRDAIGNAKPNVGCSAEPVATVPVGDRSVGLPRLLEDNECDTTHDNSVYLRDLGTPVGDVPVVASNRITCTDIPANPLVACAPEDSAPTQQGVTK
jgi:RNA polymerase sigma-70 factor (ECF subfamily)